MTVTIGRRELLAALGGAAVAWPVAARAQQPPEKGSPVIGFISGRLPDESASVVAAFQKGLSEAGYVEGQNVQIAFRWAQGQYDRLPALAADLVDRHVASALIVGSARARRRCSGASRRRLPPWRFRVLRSVTWRVQPPRCSRMWAWENGNFRFATVP
jgi:putative tryptophan/tyrosine transport system substrate-binding protein